jgi:hypothetical protein
LEELCSSNQDVDKDEEHKLRCRMDELLYNEEMMWLQRSRITWLQEGDRNTNFFHRRAAARSKKNRIKSLKKDDGPVTKEQQEMELMTRAFFSRSVHG